MLEHHFFPGAKHMFSIYASRWLLSNIMLLLVLI